MRLFIAVTAFFAFAGTVSAKDLTEAQRRATSEVFKYFECGLKESLLYTAALPNETPENIVIASAEKCKADYAYARSELAKHFSPSELPGLLATVDDQFKRNVIADVLDTRAAVQRAKARNNQ